MIKDAIVMTNLSTQTTPVRRYHWTSLRDKKQNGNERGKPSLIAIATSKAASNAIGNVISSSRRPHLSRVIDRSVFERAIGLFDSHDPIYT